MGDLISGEELYDKVTQLEAQLAAAREHLVQEENDHVHTSERLRAAREREGKLREALQEELSATVRAYDAVNEKLREALRKIERMEPHGFHARDYIEIARAALSEGEG